MGDRPILAMGNHGLTCAAATVAEAFDHLYHFERAAKILLLAYASGQPLNVMGDNLAQKTADGWRAYSEAAFAHFEQMKELLDDEDASYRE
jgi:ribulose-5-phosphate 4-epimerase/fuculose-1-phosphate aldolase